MTRILVVDDDAFFGQMLMDWLVEQGYAATRVTTAEMALERVRVEEECPDIFLVDERLGTGLSGVELISQLREVAPESDAILFTGASDPDIARRAYLAGAWRYLRRPFDPNELGYVLAALQEWRSAKAATSERDWLRVLNRIVERLQQANTVEEVGQLLVQGGVELGFDRARFYRVRTIDGAPTLFGICQSGVNPVVDFDSVVYSVEQTIYHKKAFAERKPTFFRDRQLGPSFLSTLLQAEGFPGSLGEWVILPLFSGDVCIGSVSMDNCRTVKSIHPQQKDLLRLFAGQAVSALERALRYKKEQQERGLDEMVRRILARMGDPAQKESLERLLRAIRDELTASTPAQNFLAVFTSQETDGYYTRLHIENGQAQKPYWRSDTQRQEGMIWWLLKHGEPLYFPQGTQEYREKHGLQIIGKRAARSWMGVPLQIGAEITGVLIAEDDDNENVFQPEHFELFKALADRLAGVIQTAWLNEQEHEYSELLRRLQEASELIAGFDEEKLWLTTLTLCTANYGASFDRAMLFLAEEGGTRLAGRMAIGHLQWEDARLDWEEDVRVDMDWDKFLTVLQAGSIAPTPLYGAVRDYSLTVGDDAFAEVLHGKGVIVLSKEQAQTRLPADFLTRFGLAAYCLVPVKAADQMIGVVALDNIWEKDPNRLGVLDILDNLTNQAALLHENLRQRADQDKLIDLTYDAFDLHSRTLKQSLDHICEIALSFTHADRALIYPLKPDTTYFEFDADNIGRAGEDPNLPIAQLPRPKGFTAHLLQADDPIVIIPDVANCDLSYDGEELAEHPYLQLESIRAVIGAHVRDLEGGDRLGILYLDYRRPQKFSDREPRQAKKLADLAAMFIDRAHARARERELRVLLGVMQEVLQADAGEERVVRTLLTKIHELLNQRTDLRIGLVLPVWYPHSDSRAEPTRIRQLYFLESGELSPKTEREEVYLGITGLALRTGRIQLAPNVGKSPWNNIYYGDGRFDTKSELDVPIMSGTQVIGVFNVESNELNAFSHEDAAVVERLAVIASLALERLRPQQNLDILLTSVRAITAPTKLEETLQAITDTVVRTYSTLDVLTIWYREPQGRKEVVLIGPFFGVRDEVAIAKERAMEGGVVQYVMESRTSIFAYDVKQHEHLNGDFVTREEIVSTAAFPLRFEDTSYGAMFFGFRQHHDFSSSEKTLFPILADFVATSLHNEQQHAQLQFRTTIDTIMASATPIIHDINQYTGRILRRIERLQKETALTATGRQALSELHEQTQKMSDEVTDVDLRREELTPVTIDAELPQWTTDTLSERSVPIALELNLDAPRIQVSAYPKALRRAIYDLTRNAMESMGWEESSQQLRVSTRPTPDGGQVEIRIHNNGPAIPADVQAKLFNEIYSSKGEERGIGLLFVRAAIERMDGHVWLESSTEEGGTTFAVRLQAAAAQNKNEETNHDKQT